MDFNNLNEQNTQPTKQNAQEQIKKQKNIGQLAKKIDKLEKELASFYAKVHKKEEELARLKQELKELL